MSQNFDVVIIGAGMSGLAAGIRLAMFDKKVCILESHSIPGGLNSYYQRGKRKFDVGLHALTNWTEKGVRGKPLSKIIKQLRIPYNDFKLIPQKHSRVIFPDHQLKFSNDITLLKEEILQTFPEEIDGFNKLIEYIENYDETNLSNKYFSAKEVVSTFIANETLLHMIFCPLMIYGSAWEHDMDFSQFAIMFKSIFLEGFSRPEGGVRTIINLLTEKLEEKGLMVQYKSKVQKIHTQNGKVSSVELQNGEMINCRSILSSAGYRETINLFDDHLSEEQTIKAGKMSFTESILMLDKKPIDFGIEDTIIFLNKSHQYQYRNPGQLYDNNSAVLCFPNNFQIDEESEGIYRSTMIADFDCWNRLERKEYMNMKQEVQLESIKMFHEITGRNNLNDHIVFSDIFTPKTVKRYTNHINGCVYGSPNKSRDGRTSIDGLYLMGTDQGFLGIIGAMLSGISMANYHCLQE